MKTTYLRVAVTAFIFVDFSLHRLLRTTISTETVTTPILDPGSPVNDDFTHVNYAEPHTINELTWHSTYNLKVRRHRLHKTCNFYDSIYSFYELNVN